MRRYRRGFTLIEMSIVLVIIGLIVGGILVGQSLIAAAAVRAQISQIEKYNTAANTFRGKYGYLPGDIPNPYAGQFGFQTRGTYPGTGDGNGLLQSDMTIGGLQVGAFPFDSEQAMFWVDLSAANLIEGSFSSATPTSNNTLIAATAVGQYFPQAKIGNGGYVYVWSGGWKGSNVNEQGGDGQNYFAVGIVNGSNVNGASFDAPLMTPVQAYAIDTKMDDGLPQSGGVLALGSFKGWSSGGALVNTPPREPNIGAYDPTTIGPVVAGDGVATSGFNQGVTITCYDNNAVAGATETYSVGNANMVNCMLSFRFQ
jgi:prepilin-type N-terminal cleavage/methylation domain-containing protein